ncbi:hypothetical protein A3770_04p33010 [Chloropicon primus]|uniref:Uncharacterized protein n=2 Tax=Chloropicon primus TaxID=1764295 RepID=A0A5B8MK03_9CHLO|nr:hypothetical protein A3770_04p33010 [Chloropicon primus]|eukprot:QDZ20783.1 hypothetical protein A3770_04p33010 [Chloropicon primus]
MAMGGEEGEKGTSGLSMSLDDLIKKEKKGKKPGTKKGEKGRGEEGRRQRQRGGKGRGGGNKGGGNKGGGGGDLRSRLGTRQGRVEKGGGRGRPDNKNNNRDTGSARGNAEREERPSYPEKVDYNTESGELVVTLKDVEIVRVDWSGNMTMTTGGNMTEEYFEALNRALKPILYRLQKQEENWSITDGRRIMRFFDGVCMPPTGPLSNQRAYKISQGYKYFGSSNRNGYAGRGRGRGRGGYGSYGRGRGGYGGYW